MNSPGALNDFTQSPSAGGIQANTSNPSSAGPQLTQASTTLPGTTIDNDGGKSTSPMEIDVTGPLEQQGEAGENEETYNPLTKLERIEILPELYSLMHSLQTGETQAKDFDNNAGNIRLKLANIRQTLQDIDGIEESVEQRQTKIELIQDNITRKKAFLNNLKSNIRSTFTEKEDAEV